MLRLRRDFLKSGYPGPYHGIATSTKPVKSGLRELEEELSDFFLLADELQIYWKRSVRNQREILIPGSPREQLQWQPRTDTYLSEALIIWPGLAKVETAGG